MRNTDISAASAFSRAFATHLRDLLEADGVTQDVFRKEIVNQGLRPRSQAYVSERLRGLRPVDTDFITVAATLMRTTPRALVTEVLDAIAASSTTSSEPLDLQNVRRMRQTKPNASSEYQQHTGRNLSGASRKNVDDGDELGAVASTETMIEPGDLEN